MWDPANIYSFIANRGNTGTRCKKVSNMFKVKNRYSRTSLLLLTLNKFHTFFSLWTGKCLSGSFFLCKYHYPKYKGKQMLYLTSFKIVADFLNNLNFLDISLQVHIQLLFPKKNCFSSHPSETDNIVNSLRWIFFLFHWHFSVS